MKNFKLIFSSLAFVFAITLALAFSDAKTEPAFVDKYGEFSDGCTLGELQEVNCSITNTGSPCTVEKGPENVPAFDNVDPQGNCIQPLYQPKN